MFQGECEEACHGDLGSLLASVFPRSGGTVCYFIIPHMLKIGLFVNNILKMHITLSVNFTVIIV